MYQKRTELNTELRQARVSYGATPRLKQGPSLILVSDACVQFEPLVAHLCFFGRGLQCLVMSLEHIAYIPAAVFKQELVETVVHVW